MPRKADRREQLHAAATRIIYQQGVGNLTLATVSEASGVPMGSLYYYFKTRDNVVAAVVDRLDQQMRDQITAFDERRDPASALRAFADMVLGNAAMLTSYGCPIGTLVAQLCKEQGPQGRKVGRVLDRMAIWAAGQFEALGLQPDAAERAGRALLIRLEGAAMMAHATGDQSYVTDTMTDIQRELDAYASPSKGQTQ